MPVAVFFITEINKSLKDYSVEKNIVQIILAMLSK